MLKTYHIQNVVSLDINFIAAQMQKIIEDTIKNACKSDFVTTQSMNEITMDIVKRIAERVYSKS